MPRLFSFFDVFPEVERIEVVDVGALPLEGSEEVYAPLISAARARLTAFEPNTAGLAALRGRLGDPHRFFPHFIGSGGPAIFHETEAPMCGSLYPPNERLLGFYPDVLRPMRLKATHAVETRRLDDIEGLERIDFLKLDVQGAELDVLRGAGHLLKDMLVVQAEVEFLPLYEGQPLFADVDAFMRASGFQFHAFGGLAQRFVWPFQKVASSPLRGMNQTLWADALYIRDLTKISDLAPQRRMIFAALMHELCGSLDVALLTLQSLEGTRPDLDVGTYRHRLMNEALSAKPT